MDDRAPIIVTALLGAADSAWAEGLRRAHFPPERNLVPAHVTLFHQLAPSLEAELRRRLSAATRGVPAPEARLAGVLFLGQGVAYRIDSPGLAIIRAELADAFGGMLIPQDRAGWRAHVTIQNKAAPATAKALFDHLSGDFRPRPIAVAGLAAWRYRGGPWEALSRHMFG